MKLQVLERSIPIKSIPEEELNRIILTDFLTWVCDLLSLTDEVSAKRLKIALPAIKIHCWSYGFDEIKKMFELYADNKLSIKPMPNYFDRILFGKIVAAYKEQKVKEIKVIEPIVISEEDKRNNEIMSACICFDYYIQNGILNDTSLYLYSVLKEKGLMIFTKTEVDIMIEKSKELEKPLEEQRLHYKKMCLRRYFDKLHATNEHLKDLI